MATFQLVYYATHVGADPNKRERWRGSPYFDDCAAFCERWDQASFDPDYASEPLDFFADMTREVFARTPYDAAVIRPGAREPLAVAEIAAQRAR
jgi:predicted HD phosphohydrolase